MAVLCGNLEEKVLYGSTLGVYCRRKREGCLFPEESSLQTQTTVKCVEHEDIQSVDQGQI
jgi:hypothetical protein